MWPFPPAIILRSSVLPFLVSLYLMSTILLPTSWFPQLSTSNQTLQERFFAVISTLTSACISSPALCSVQTVPECLSFAVTTVILGKRCLSTLIDPGSSLSFVNEEIATPDLSVIPQRFNGSGFVERIRSWPLLDRNNTKRYGVWKWSVKSYEKLVLWRFAARHSHLATRHSHLALMRQYLRLQHRTRPKQRVYGVLLGVLVVCRLYDMASRFLSRWDECCKLVFCLSGLFLGWSQCFWFHAFDDILVWLTTIATWAWLTRSWGVVHSQLKRDQ